MKRIQSFFRNRHNLLFSAVAILLVFCMLPFTAYAADYTIEFTESNKVKANGTGGGSISATSSDCHGTSGTHAGYRIYMVDKDGNLLKDEKGESYVKDLLTSQAKTMYGVPKKLDYDKVYAEVNIYGDEETILSKF